MDWQAVYFFFALSEVFPEEANSSEGLSKPFERFASSGKVFRVKAKSENPGQALYTASDPWKGSARWTPLHQQQLQPILSITTTLSTDKAFIYSKKTFNCTNRTNPPYHRWSRRVFADLGLGC